MLPRSRQRPRLLLRASLLWYLTLVGIAVAQKTDVVCDPAFEWLNNDRKQSPCLVAAYLGTQCLSGAEYVVPALQSGRTYTAPKGQDANQCQCNTVMFSLLSACATCQRAVSIRYSEWIGSCPADIIRNSTYPLSPPTGTTIPLWAFLPLKADSLDLVAVRTATGTAPTDVPSPKSGLSTTSIVLISLGSVVGFGLLVVLLWYLWRYKLPRYRGVRPLPTHRSFERPVGRGTYEPIDAPKPPGLFFFPRKVQSRPPSQTFDLAVEGDQTVLSQALDGVRRSSSSHRNARNGGGSSWSRTAGALFTGNNSSLSSLIHPGRAPREVISTPSLHNFRLDGPPTPVNPEPPTQALPAPIPPPPPSAPRLESDQSSVILISAEPGQDFTLSEASTSPSEAHPQTYPHTVQHSPPVVLPRPRANDPVMLVPSAVRATGYSGLPASNGSEYSHGR